MARARDAKVDPSALAREVLGARAQEVLAHVEAWQAYRSERRLKAWCATTWRVSLGKAKLDPISWNEAVETAIGAGWQGLFPRVKAPRELRVSADLRDFLVGQ
jgi:hypothetical protein